MGQTAEVQVHYREAEIGGSFCRWLADYRGCLGVGISSGCEGCRDSQETCGWIWGVFHKSYRTSSGGG